MASNERSLGNFLYDLFFQRNRQTNARVRTVKTILWAIVGLATPVAIARFVFGLGATTNLSDKTPWGLWIGFDVVGGVALAAGGFVIAAAVYIFHMERFRPIVRAAVLTAFLGYVAVAVGLLFDLGIPWNIWRPTVFWQHHSALFEVAWCVMLYLTVLGLEFAPVVFEKIPFPRIYAFFKRIALPLVIVGIMLSTLHQSSLGTLFLIMPDRVHPLWYTSILPLLFFVSAVGLALGMVTLESLGSAWLFRRPPEVHLLKGLARAASWVLGLYLVIRLGDLVRTGHITHVIHPTWETWVFLLEILLSAVIPVVLFAIPRVRTSPAGLWTGAILIVFGFIFNRINVSGISTISATGTDYIPAWTEVAISVGVVSAAALAFLFFVEHFNVYVHDEPHAMEPGGEGGPVTAEEKTEGPVGATLALPTDPVTGVRLVGNGAADGVLYSLVYVVAAAVAVLLLPSSALEGARPVDEPVQRARQVSALKVEVPEQRFHAYVLDNQAEESRPVLMIDANRNGRYVLFDHLGHQQRQGGLDSCGKCHHMNQPFDEATACWQCHGDMFTATPIFDHDLHAQRMGGNEKCIECHRDPQAVKSVETARPCMECHEGMVVEDSFVTKTFVRNWRDSKTLMEASSYMDALHGLCIKCHEDQLRQREELGKDFARCAACHGAPDAVSIRSMPPYRPWDSTEWHD